MTTLAVTGADGFLGWHLRCRVLADHHDVTVIPLGRAAFESNQLVAAIETADVVVHLAAINSHDRDLAAANDSITTRLIDALETSGSTAKVVVANSIHSQQDSSFGLEKRRVVERLRGWADAVGGSVSDVILPNLFGECGRANYNSVVATMCDSLVTRGTFDPDPHGWTSLVHTQVAAQALIDSAIQANSTSSDSKTTVAGREIAVVELFELLSAMYQTYVNSHEIPFLADEFELRLFNQLRERMYREHPAVSLENHRDARGSYAELVRSDGASQTSVSSTVPGARRGEHFHFDKIERFCVLSGEAQIRVRRLFDSKIDTFTVNGEDRVILDMPTLHTHDLTNIGRTELLTVFWSNGHFDAARPDTHREPVENWTAR